MRNLVKQVFKFGIVGGLAFLIDYGVLWALVELFGVNYLASSALSFAVSVVFNYILSSLWVFDCSNSSKAGEFLVFVILSVIGLLLNLGIMFIGVNKLGGNYLFVKVASTAIVMVYNFVTRKLILEQKSQSIVPHDAAVKLP